MSRTMGPRFQKAGTGLGYREVTLLPGVLIFFFLAHNLHVCPLRPLAWPLGLVFT